MISPTAIVRDCQIGEGTKVWNYANLYGCKIGTNCDIGSFVEITSGVVIGNNVTISSHSFICDRVTIENDVFIGHGVMTINDLYPPSKKRRGSNSEWKDTRICRGAMVGTGATLLPIRIGKYAKVGAGAVVTRDVAEGQTVIGNPARSRDERESS